MTDSERVEALHACLLRVLKSRPLYGCSESNSDTVRDIMETLRETGCEIPEASKRTNLVTICAD